MVQRRVHNSNKLYDTKHDRDGRGDSHFFKIKLILWGGAISRRSCGLRKV
jgi:hypothetical protein